MQMIQTSLSRLILILADFRNLTMLTSGLKTIKWSLISLKQKRLYSGDLIQDYT